MSHNVQGLIATLACFDAGAELAPRPRIAALEQGFGLLLIRGEAGDPEADPIPSDVASVAQTLSAHSPVAFVETAYFGGAGVQRAALWTNGTLVRTCLTRTGESEPGDRAINTILRALGVEVGENFDEFAAIGLMDHRSNKEWLAAIQAGTVIHG